MMHELTLMAGINRKNTSTINYSTAQEIASRAALIGWYLFALFATFSTAGSNISLAIILLSTVIVFPKFWKDVRYTPTFWMILALATYILIRSLLALYEAPLIQDAINPHWTHFLRMSGLIALPLGWWLYRHSKHLNGLLITALTGFFIGAIYSFNWTHILSGSSYCRTI